MAARRRAKDRHRPVVATHRARRADVGRAVHRLAPHVTLSRSRGDRLPAIDYAVANASS
jgi:hypothetical protein